MRHAAPRRLLAAALAAGGLAVRARDARALDPQRAVSQYGRQSWTTEQGLPQNTVQALAQTRDGYLWIGTQEGLARFDGVRFTLFDRRSTPGLRHSSIFGLWAARDGALWAATLGGGLTRVKGGVFTTWGRAEGLADDQVLSVCEDEEGTIWYGTLRGGLGRLDGGKPVVVESDRAIGADQVPVVIPAKGGGVWFGTSGGGVFQLRGGVRKGWTTRDGLANGYIWSLHEDRAGTLWVGTLEGGLHRLSEGRVTPHALPGGAVRSIHEDRDGNLWVGTSRGLHRLRGGAAGEATLTGDTILALCEDREGNVWAGGHDGGLHRLRGDRFTVFGTSEGLPSDMIRAVCASRDGGVWVGTQSGLGRVRERRAEALRGVGLLAKEYARSACEGRDGTLWVGTAGRGLWRVEKGAARPVPIGIDQIFSLLSARDGSLWIGTLDRGVIRIRDGKRTDFSAREGITSHLVTVLYEDRAGAVWAGTNGGGLFRVKDGTVSSVTTKNGLTNDLVLALHESADGALWIGTFGGGLDRLKDGKLASVSSKQGLLDDVVFQILPDARGNLWLSSNRGIFRVAESELAEAAAGTRSTVSVTAFGTADGMRSPECNAGTGAVSRDGRLFFPTVKGLVAIDPGRLPVNQAAPPVLVEEVLVDGKRAAEGPLVLPPGTRRLEIHYTALGLTAPERVRFRTFLEGFDDEWVDAGGERSVRFTNLSPGPFRFRVKACNEDGVWNEAGASLAFSLRPRAWQTWWFYALAAAAVAGGAFGAHRARVARLKAQRAELQRLVDEAQEKLAKLLESPASQTLPEWSKSIAGEVSAAIGAERIGVWEVDRDGLSPLSDGGAPPPDSGEVRRLAAAAGFVEAGERTLVPVTGQSGELCGAIAVHGRVAWGETEKRLVAGFAHQLGGTLSMARLRRQLAAAEERRAASRREMHERGIATLQVCPVCGRCYDDEAAACAEDGAALESPRLLPFRLLDRYRFVKALGEGGMGMILSAFDEKLGREVAIKLIRPEHFGNADMKVRFEREARTVARIQHPGVIALHDSGELADGSAFLVMERLTGRDLAQLLGEHGRGTPAQAAELLRQGGAALGAAHRAGVVHRDVKPENLFLVAEGAGFRVKVLDFGLAKSAVYEKGLTQSGVIVGTPSFMAPEQVRGEGADARSDLYSFAAVCYEALTGVRAIPGEDLARIMLNVLTHEPAPVSCLVPGAPAAVDEAFRDAFAKDPARRPREIEAWAAPLADALEAVPSPAAVSGWPAP